MENNPIDPDTPGSLAWPVLLLVGSGLWYGLAYDEGLAALPIPALLVVTAIVWFVWLVRARAAKRFNAMVNAYALREIDRERRKELRRVRGVSDSEAALPIGSPRAW